LGEAIALQYLLSKGHTLVAQNWRCVLGELDLVTQHQGELVFIEVKTKRSGDPFSNIDFRKQRKLRQCVELYLRRFPSARIPSHRVDVVGVRIDTSSCTHRIEHLEAAL